MLRLHVDEPVDDVCCVIHQMLLKSVHLQSDYNTSLSDIRQPLCDECMQVGAGSHLWCTAVGMTWPVNAAY